MASEILGLFASPELYQQQQDALMQQQAAQYANLDPYQRAEYGAYLGGRRLGAALGRMLGGEDPQLKIISARQSVMQNVDPSNPESIIAAAQQLAEVGDQQGALTLADYARKAQSELALQQQRMREGRAASMPEKLRIANARAELLQQRRTIQALPADAPNREEALRLIDDTLAGLPAPDGTPKFGEKVETKSFELFGKPYAEISLAERKTVNDAIRSEEKKPEKEVSYGTDREAAAQELYNANFGSLTQTQKAAVNKLVEERQGTRVEKGAPKFVMPGKKEPIDIPKLRKSLTDSLEPYKSTIDAGDSAVSLLNQAKVNKNASSFNSGITELAKMTQGGRLSNKDVELAKVDPAVLRRASDFVSTTFQGVPTESTINDIISTVKLLRKVAADKYAREVKTQRKIAAKADIDQETIDILFEDTTLPTASAGRGKTTTRTLKSGKTVTITED